MIFYETAGNAGSLLFGIIAFYSSFKFIFPAHSLFPSYCVGFHRLAKSMRMTGQGDVIRVTVGTIRFIFGLTSAILPTVICYWQGQVGNTTAICLGISIFLVNVSAVFSLVVGFSACLREFYPSSNALLLSISGLMTSYLQASLGSLKEYSNVAKLVEIYVCFEALVLVLVISYSFRGSVFTQNRDTRLHSNKVAFLIEGNPSASLLDDPYDSNAYYQICAN